MKKSDLLALKFGELVLNKRWWVIALTLIIVTLATMGGERLVFNNDYRAFFNGDNPELLAFEHMENTYSGRDENVFIVLAPKNGNIFTRENLAAVEKYTKAAWQTPHSTRVDSITNFQNSHANADELIVEELVKDAASLSDAEIENIRKTALAEPLLVKRVISEKGHVAAINVTIQLPGIDPVAEEPAVVKFSRDLAAQIRKENPDMQVHLTGMVMLNAAFGEAAEHDMSTLMPLTFLAFLVSIVLLTRGWTSAFASFWLITFSIMAAMGIAGWFRIDLTSISSSAPTMILTLAIANTVHVLVIFINYMRKGYDKHNAMLESIRSNWYAIAIVNITTALGFFQMNFSESPVFRDLGNIVGIGVMFSFVLSLTFLPALMMVLPMKKPALRAENEADSMESLAEFVIKHNNKLFWGVGGLCIFLAAFVAKNDLNDEWIQYFGEDMEFRQATDFTTENLTGAYRVDYSLNAKEADGISDPEFLRKVQAFTDWYKQQPEVVQVNALTDIITRLNKNMHGDAPEYLTIPENRELSAQYLLLYEMSLPYGLDLNNQINMDKSATRVTVVTKNLPVKQTLALEERAQAWLSANAPEIRSAGTGSTIMFAHIGVRNIESMLWGSVFGLVIISGILIYAFRSFKIGFLSLIPNLIPSIMGFGLWGLLVGEVGLGLATVAGVTMGIVVDDTVHFLNKYLHGRRDMGLGSEDSIRYAFSSMGTAMWFTTFILVAGFAVLAFSSFKLNGDMGLLTAIILIFALIGDFFLLPPLLMKFDRAPAAAKQSQPIENVELDLTTGISIEPAKF
ncbi:MAG TPA: MMPL family transporter [Cellvibrio sp.]